MSKQTMNISRELPSRELDPLLWHMTRRETQSELQDRRDLQHSPRSVMEAVSENSLLNQMAAMQRQIQVLEQQALFLQHENGLLRTTIKALSPAKNNTRFFILRASVNKANKVNGLSVIEEENHSAFVCN